MSDDNVGVIGSVKDFSAIVFDGLSAVSNVACEATDNLLNMVSSANTNNFFERFARFLEVPSQSMPLIAGFASSCIALSNTMQSQDAKNNSYLKEVSIALATGLSTHIFVDGVMKQNPTTSVVGLGSLMACIVANGLFNQMINLLKINNASIDVMSLLTSCFIGFKASQLGGK